MFGLLGALVFGCSGGAGGHVVTTGAGGTTGGTAGTTGTSGTTGGTAGATDGTAGATGDTAGTTGVSGTTGGTAGTTDGTAGTIGAGGGTAGAGGSTGTAGAGGATAMGGGGGRPSGPSSGCMKPPPSDEPLGSCLMHNITITGMAQQYVAGYGQRAYGATIPKGYDPTMQYPVVIYGPGCGGESCEGGPFTGRTDIFVIQATKAAAVYNGMVPPIPPAAAPGCFQTGVISTVDSPEINYFDQVLADVESKYCIDQARVFVAGSSSGAWFANYLACARGNVIRGAAADSGGIAFDRPTCTGGAGVVEFPGDSATKTDSSGNAIGAAVARDLFIKTNGCSMTPTSMKIGTATCDVYGGCTSPVAWRNVGGGHQSGLGSINPVGWPFWSMLQ